MRFDLPESITAMREGRKTQTRRRSTFWLKKEPGSHITIVHRGELLGMARVVATRRQCLADVRESEAQAEGYDCRACFFEALYKLYPGWDSWADIRDEEVTVVEFTDITWLRPKDEEADPEDCALSASEREHGFYP